MSDQGQDDVMFQIGVMEDPKTASRLTSLAKSVEQYQKGMSDGVTRIGENAESVKASITGMTAQLGEYRQAVTDAIRQVKTAYSELQSVAAQKVESIFTVSVTGNPTQAGDAAPSQASTVGDTTGPERIAHAAEEATVAVEEMREAAAKPLHMDDSFAPHMRAVFKDLADVAEADVQRIESALEQAVAGVPTSATEMSRQITEGSRSMAVERSAALADMARDMDGYVAKEGSASQKIAVNLKAARGAVHEYQEAHAEAMERVDQATIKGLRSAMQMAKGVAEIGLMSESSVQKFMQTMAVVQGLFDVFEGAADMLEGFQNGMRASAKATDAMNKATQAAQVLQSEEFVRLNAYSAALTEEAVAAETAAAAHVHLNRARVSGGAGPTSLAATAVGMSSVPAGAARAGSGVAGGAAAMSGLVTTAAAAAAALAGLSLVAVEGAEIATGWNKEKRSVTMGIANAEVEFSVGLWKMTGLFNKAGGGVEKSLIGVSSMLDKLPVIGEGGMLNQMNFFGDLATAARTSAVGEKLNRKNASDKAINDATAAQEETRSDAKREKGRNIFRNAADATRNRYSLTGDFDLSSLRASQGGDAAQRQLDLARKEIEQYAAGQVSSESPKSLYAAEETATQGVIGSIDSQRIATQEKGANRLTKELQIQAEAASQVSKYQEMITKNLDGQSMTHEQNAKALEQAKYWNDEIIVSLEKQRSIHAEAGSERLAVEQRVQEFTKSQIDVATSRIQQLNDMRRSAAVNFARMGEAEKDMAKRALDQAKIQGAESLEKPQRELLRQVGTAEANRFAEEADLAEAKKAGFDTSFGKSVDQDVSQFESQRKTLEAKLQASYDVSVRVQMDTNAIVDQVVSKAAEMVRANNAIMEKQIDRRVVEAVGAASQEANQKQALINANQKGMYTQ